VGKVGQVEEAVQEVHHHLKTEEMALPGKNQQKNSL
jgi:hypothetical protein